MLDTPFTCSIGCTDLISGGLLLVSQCSKLGNSYGITTALYPCGYSWEMFREASGRTGQREDLSSI